MGNPQAHCLNDVIRARRIEMGEEKDISGSFVPREIPISYLTNKADPGVSPKALGKSINSREKLPATPI